MLAHSLTVSDGFGLCFGRSKFSLRDFRDYPETSATYQCPSRNYEISELPLRPYCNSGSSIQYHFLFFPLQFYVLDHSAFFLMQFD